MIAGNPELFGGYARSTVYGWIGDGLFAAKKHDLPFAGTRCRPRRRPETKTSAKCRIGRGLLRRLLGREVFGCKTVDRNNLTTAAHYRPAHTVELRRYRFTSRATNDLWRWVSEKS